MENCYKILGVRPEATLSEIKRAYREKAKSLHPDSSGNNANALEFNRLVNAYRVLSDSRQRSIFDESFFTYAHKKYSKSDSFDYYQWLKSRSDEESRAKFIFYTLMHHKEDEAVSEFKQMQINHRNFSLQKWFSYRDFMDFGYILAEELVIRCEYYDAFTLLEEIIKLEYQYNYFKIFFPEVQDFTLNMLKRNIEGVINDELALDVYERALDLEFGRKADSIFLKKMAVIYSRMGDERTASICLNEALKI